jgi:hypothetical protein
MILEYLTFMFGIGAFIAAWMEEVWMMCFLRGAFAVFALRVIIGTLITKLVPRNTTGSLSSYV